MKRIILIILLICCLPVFVYGNSELVKKDITEIKEKIEKLKIEHEKKIKETSPVIDELSQKFTELNESKKSSKNTDEIELIDLEILNTEEKKRLIEAENLLIEKNIEMLENKEVEFIKILEKLSVDEQYVKVLPPPSKITEFVKYIEKLHKELKIEEGKMKITSSDLKVKEKEIISFSEKVEKLRKVYNSEHADIMKLDEKKQSKHKLQILKFNFELIDIKDKVKTYLERRISYVREKLDYETKLISYLKLRQTVLKRVQDKIGEIAIEKAQTNLKEKRLIADKSKKKNDKKKRRLEYSNRVLNRIIEDTEKDIRISKKRAAGIKNREIAELVKNNPVFKLETVKLRKELLNIKLENIDIRNASKTAVVFWEKNKLKLEKKEIETEELTRLTEEAKSSLKKYREKLRINKEEIELIKAQSESEADELSDVLSRIETAEEKEKSGKLKKYLEEKEQIYNEKIDIIEEKEFLVEQRQDYYSERIIAIENYITEVGKYGAIIFFGNTMQQYFYFALALLGNLFLALLLYSIVFRWLLSYTSKTSINADYVVMKVISKPFVIGVMLLGFYFSLNILYIPERVLTMLFALIKGLIILDIAFLIMRGVDIVVHFVKPLVEKTDSKLDDQLLPIVSKVSKFMIIMIGFIMFTESMGYPATSLLTGLGIGGLAFALAAKDTLSNIFGSMMIFSDKIFQIGDWVKFDDNEGIIEEIGIRSTKIRKFDHTMIIIPNSTIANANITNISRFEKRRIYYKLGLTYNSGHDGIKKGVDIIRDILDNHPMIAKDHYIFFTDFGPCSLDIMCYFFANTTVWREYLDVRQEVNIEIMRRLEEAGLSIAFPTQTLNFDEDAISAIEKRVDFNNPLESGNKNV